MRGDTNVLFLNLHPPERVSYTNFLSGVYLVSYVDIFTLPCLLGTLAAPRPEPLAQLIGFPLTSFELSLLTSYALNPPSLPSDAVAVLQELVCVRLIQSADYVEAIKLDRQFNAVSGSSSNKERKQLMDDIMSTLPPAERWLLEGELGQVATGVRVSAPTTFLNGRRERRESGRSRVPLADLSMSWDEVRSSPSASASIMTSIRGKGVSPSVAPSPSPLGMGNALSRSNVNGAALSTDKNIFASASSAGKPSQSIAQSFTVLGPRPISSTVPRASASGVTSTAAREVASPAHANPPQTSLFEKSGSAKHAPNAFYKPPLPPPRMSIETPAAAPALSISINADVATSVTPPPEDDMSVEYEGPASEDEGKEDSDGKAEFITFNKEADNTVLPTDADDIPDFGYSVFGGTAPAIRSRKSNDNGVVPDRRSPTSSPLSPRESVQDGKRRAPPGAFHIEEAESDGEPPSPRRSTRTRSRASAPRATRSTWAVKGAGLSQSIPGSLIDEDEEHEEATVKEEEDDVAPLPPSRPPRKTRATTSSKSRAPSTVKAATQPKTPQRRSSRLSTASLSPDGLDTSPPSKATVSKPRKSTRTSTAGASTVSTRSNARRKR